MKQSKCSMQKKKESLSKKFEANIDDLKGMVVSEGTMGVNALIRKYLDVLETYAPDNYKAYIEANPELKDRDVWMALDVRDKSYIVDELADELDKIAPEGYYFGASEGDGACYGFWEVEPDESKKPEACKGGKDDDKKGGKDGKAAESKKSESRPSYYDHPIVMKATSNGKTIYSATEDGDIFTDNKNDAYVYDNYDVISSIAEDDFLKVAKHEFGTGRIKLAYEPVSRSDESKKSEDTKVGKFTIMPKDTSRKQAGIKAYQTRLGEMGFKSNLHNNGDYTHDYVKEIGKIPGATVYVGTIDNFQKNTQEYQYEAELYMENEKGIRSNIEYMPFAITDISDGMQRKMYFNRLNALIKKGTDFVNNHESSESKKSEGIDDHIKMNIDYNTFMRLLDAAAYLDADDDYKDALWEYYSEFGELDGDACEFFDNLFQYTDWYTAEEVWENYDNILGTLPEGKNAEEALDAYLEESGDDLGGSSVYKHGDHYLILQ